MAPRELYSCPSCQRHLFTHQQACPFCDEPQKERGSRLSAGLLALGLGVAVSGCEQEEVERESRDGGVKPGVDMLLDQSVRTDLDAPQPPYGSPELDMRVPTDIDAPQPAYGGPELVDFAVYSTSTTTAAAVAVAAASRPRPFFRSLLHCHWADKSMDAWSVFCSAY